MATSPANYARPQQRRQSSTQRANRSSRLRVVQRAATDRASLDQSLGWFSLGLGLAQVFAPKALGRLIGVGDQSTVMRMCGAREIVSGVGLLSGRAPAAFAVSRVVGDAMDLALLGAALRSPQADPARIAATATAVMGVTAADLYASKLDLRATMVEASEEVPVSVSLMVNSPPEKLYDFWRKLTNLPRFLQTIESVQETGERTSHWVAKAPGGMRVAWDSEIVEDQPGEFISWRTRDGSDVNHCGSVRFEPATSGKGTIVRVAIYYGLPGGPLAAKAAKMLSAAPESVVIEDLRRFKQLIETGEIATTRGQPSGARSLLGRTFSKGSS